MGDAHRDGSYRFDRLVERRLLYLQVPFFILVKVVALGKKTRVSSAAQNTLLTSPGSRFRFVYKFYNNVMLVLALNLLKTKGRRSSPHHPLQRCFCHLFSLQGFPCSRNSQLLKAHREFHTPQTNPKPAVVPKETSPHAHSASTWSGAAPSETGQLHSEACWMRSSNRQKSCSFPARAEFAAQAEPQIRWYKEHRDAGTELLIPDIPMSAVPKTAMQKMSGLRDASEERRTDQETQGGTCW